MPSPVLSIKVVSDTSDAERGLGRVEARAGKLGSAVQKATPYAAGALAGLTALGKGAFDAASSLQQSTGGVEAAFGKQASAVKKYADQSANSVGLAKSDYQDLATVIGSQLKNMGVPTEQLAGQTNELITKGADLAATFGGSTADAVSALSSLMRGETDPIERYGVSIKQADVQAQKAKMGLTGLTGAADKQATTQATLALLTKQTADASGAFAREADTAAGAQARAGAQAKDAAAQIGTALLPVVTLAAGGLQKFGEFAQQNAGLVQALAVVIGVIAAAILVASAAQTVWNIAMSANPIGLIILAIAALIAIIILVVKNWDTVKGVFLTGVKVVANAFKAGFNAIASYVNSKIAALKRLVLAFVTANVTAGVRIRTAITAAFTAVASWVSSKIAAARRYVSAFITANQTAGSRIRGYLTAPFTYAAGVINSKINQGKAYVARLSDAARTARDRIKSYLSSAWAGPLAALRGFASSVQNAIWSVINTVASLAGRIRGAFSISPPAWLSGLGGLFAAPASQFTASVHQPAAMTAAVSGMPSSWPGRTGGTGGRAAGPSVVIYVNGGLDSGPTIAKRIRDVLNTDARTRGAVELGGVVVR